MGAGLLWLSTAHTPAAAVCGLLAMAPMWIACRQSGMAGAIALGCGTGVLYGIACGVWIPDALRVLGSTILDGMIGLVVVAAWVEGPKFGFWGAMAWSSRSLSVGGRAVALAAAVLGAEWLVSTTWWGVPWGLLAHSQLDLPGVPQLAVAGGAPLVSALLAAFSAAAAASLTGDRGGLRILCALAAAWIALLALGNPVALAFRDEAEHERAVEILFVQPSLPRSERWRDALQLLNLHRVQRFSNAVLQEQPPGLDALVFPENLLTSPLDQAPDLANALQAWVDATSIPFITGLVLSPQHLGPGHYRSAVVWIEPGKGTTARLDKERAIPLLESARRFPGDLVLRRLFGGAAAWPRVEESVESAQALRGPFTVSPVLCYEILFPRLVAERRSADSLAVLNVADDSWAPSAAVSRHLTRIARYRAIEQRLPVIRLAHGGLSAVIDPLGRVEARLPMEEYAALRRSLRPMPPPSHFERATIAGLPLMAFGVVWWAWGAQMRRSGRGSSR